MSDENKRGLDFAVSGNQLVIAAVVIAAAWFGGKWAVRAGVDYVRGEVRAEVLQVVSELTNGRIDIDRFKKDNGGNGGKKLLPFASGEATED